MSKYLITLFLCGDVMTGRGIDQILPYPSNPILYESYMKSALGYVELAEEENGLIPKPVDFTYIWGDALQALEKINPAVKIINLETSITSHNEPAHKGIHYRMNPKNIGVLTAFKVDGGVLSNNHVLDWGEAGLIETLNILKVNHIKTAGAGENLKQAEAPMIFTLNNQNRILVFSLGTPSSGIPLNWAAGEKTAGINLLPDFSENSIKRLQAQILGIKKPGDITIVSIHWGENWGYEIPEEHQQFAHALIDKAGVDIIHGHSSHHVKGIEIYKNKLILYGCGDFINDYEGISGYESYRSDLTLMYFPSLDATTGNLVSLTMIPLQIKKFRLNKTTQQDMQWLKSLLNREGKFLPAEIKLEKDMLVMRTQ